MWTRWKQKFGQGESWTRLVNLIRELGWDDSAHGDAEGVMPIEGPGLQLSQTVTITPTGKVVSEGRRLEILNQCLQSRGLPTVAIPAPDRKPDARMAVALLEPLGKRFPEMTESTNKNPVIQEQCQGVKATPRAKKEWTQSEVEALIRRAEEALEAARATVAPPVQAEPEEEPDPEVEEFHEGDRMSGTNPNRAAAAARAWLKPRKLPRNQGGVGGEMWNT
jgi:hypothetical protein